MIRFVEMKGIYIEDEIKSFGFYNTVTDTFIGLNGSYTFDNVKDFEYLYDNNCGVDFERMKRLIPQSWYDYEKTLSQNGI